MFNWNSKLINLFLFLLYFPFLAKTQIGPTENRKIDSLNLVIKLAKNDSIKIKAMRAWDDIIYVSNPELDFLLNRRIDSITAKNLKRKLSVKEKRFYLGSLAYCNTSFGILYASKSQYNKALECYNIALNAYKELKDESGIAKSLGNIGTVYYRKGDIFIALEMLNKSIEVKRKVKDIQGLAYSYLNVASIHKDLNDYSTTIDYCMKALKLAEEIDDKFLQAGCHLNIGVVYIDLQDYKQAKKHLTQCIALYKRIEDKVSISYAFENIGNILVKEKKYKLAKSYYDSSNTIRKDFGDFYGQGLFQLNVGAIFEDQQKYDSALLYYNNSIIFFDKILNLEGKSKALNRLGTIYYKQGKFNKAIQVLEKSTNNKRYTNSSIDLIDAYSILKKCYVETKNYSAALIAHEKYAAIKDSMWSEKNQKEVIRQQYKYEYEKQAAADSVKNLEEKKVKDAFIAQQKADINLKRNQQYMLYGGLVLVILFAVFIFNRFRVTKKQKGIIEYQKTEVEEKNKEITDSINYAKRIQNAILPPAKIINESLPQSFVLYKPKDIVAGDFYWLEKKGETFLFAACDCTGHGVPGAMVSVICNNGLNRSVREHNLTDPGKILDKTREIVIQEFEKSEEEVKDGMDVSLLAFNGNAVKWSGANNPLWLIRNGELIEYKANKQPIGKYANPKPFTTHDIAIQKGDSLYIFTDGLQDQFGGEKGKKFKAAKLKELLLSIQDKTMTEQMYIIENAFDQWKGNLEQNDDVCMVGVKI